LKEHFCKDSYLYDLFENDEEIEQALTTTLADKEKYQTLNNDQKDILSKLPNKEFIINDPNLFWFQLLDIIFAYFYEYIVMNGDFGSESAATINRISSSLSCFCVDHQDPSLLLA